MRRPTWLALALLAGCAPASSPSSSVPLPTDTVVVTAPSSSARAPVAALPPSARSPRPPTLDTCVASLRATLLGPPSADSDLYLRALGDERRNQFFEARKAYFQLLEVFPQSVYLPYAHLAFGEMFLLDAAAEPTKWALARQAYLKALEYPPDTNPVSTYAMLRASEAFLRTGATIRALDMARRTVEATAGRAPCAAEIRRGAIAMTIEAYATTGRPERALAYFSSFLPEPDELDQTLIDLGKRYATTDPRPVCALLASGVSAPVKQALDPSCSP